MKIEIKMLFRDMMKDTHKPAFEDREEVFGSVRVGDTGNILILFVVNGLMSSKILVKMIVCGKFIRHYYTRFLHVVADNSFQILTRNTIHFLRPNTTAALNESKG